MILIEDLEKKINSELTTKIKESKILHGQLYLSINFEDLEVSTTFFACHLETCVN